MNENPNLEELMARLHEVDRIRAHRASVPAGSTYALWAHEDIDTLLRLLWMQAMVMKNIDELQAQIAEQNHGFEKLIDQIDYLKKRIEESGK